MGVAASSRIKKSVLCLVTNSVSVDQWKHQYKLWTGLQDHQISRSPGFRTFMSHTATASFLSLVGTLVDD